MNKYQMAQHILSLASGTVAQLCGSGKYEEIDFYTAQWLEWVAEQHCKLKWSSWMDCHQSYVDHLTDATLAAGFKM